MREVFVEAFQAVLLWLRWRFWMLVEGIKFSVSPAPVFV